MRVLVPGCALSAAVLVASSVPAVPQAAQVQAVAPAAQTSTADLPSARSIVDRHVEAIGGRATILSYKSSHLRGRINMPANGLSGPMEMFAAAPNRSLMRMTLTGIGDLQEGFDGTVAWMNSPVTGPMLAEGRQLEQKRFDSEFYGELKAPDRYKAIETVERTTFDGRSVYKVRFVNEAGVEDIEFYEVESGLKAGGQMSRDTPMGPIATMFIYSDYRKFGKILQPATQKLTTMGMEQILTVESIEFDRVDPKVFELPVAIKALIK